MGNNVVTQNNAETCAALGLVTRFEIGASVAAAGFYYVGLTTPVGPQVRVMSRQYSSSESSLTVELFEATWSAGSAVRTLNRNLAVTPTPPLTLLGNVTPGALGSVITGVTIRAATGTGTSAIQISGDESLLLLKANTNYVIRFTNSGGQIATVSAGLDLRQAMPSDYAALAPNAI